MIFNKRKKEKIRQNIIDNLTLCRLEGDLLAVEAAIRDNAPKAEPEVEGNRIKKFVAGLVNELGNTVRAATVRELSVDKEAAADAIKSFCATFPCVSTIRNTRTASAFAVEGKCTSPF